MFTKSQFWRRVRNACLALLLIGGTVSLNGCIFIRGGHHHHWHHDWD